MENTMNKPLMNIKLELWSNSKDFLEHGIPWYQKLAWKVFDKKAVEATKKKYRGMYNSLSNTIVICMDEIDKFSFAQNQQNVVKNFNSVFADYFTKTLIHEMIHALKLGDERHEIDWDRLVKLDNSICSLIGYLLDTKNTTDKFVLNYQKRIKDEEEKAKKTKG